MDAVFKSQQFEAIVIGTSAGGVEALLQIFPRLPAGFPLPILTVIHLPPDRHSGMADLFALKCQVRVKEAEDKEPIEPGCIYFAPPNYHILVESDRRLSLSAEEPVMYSRPSIDVLFESAADVYGEKLLGIILTGASSDGTNGLRKVCDAGGVGIVECPESAYVPTMPQSAS
ncbi:MAG: chemotaxis protein CheB, partial [Limisphaerales bacterium]